MRTPLLLLLAGLLASPSPTQEERPKPPEKKKGGNAVTRFFQGESERLSEEVQGTWMLMDYTDPGDPGAEGAGSGFATFQDGFLTLALALDTVDQRLFHFEDRIVLHSGLYRFRFDEQASLQLAGVLVFTNESDDGDVERERDGLVLEYSAQIVEGVLELRNAEGVLYSFRKLAAGEFPDSAIRKLERRRGGAGAWEDEEDER